MAVTVDQLTSQLRKLLPPSAVLSRANDTNIERLLSGSAEEIARLHERVTTLLDESHPHTATEMIEEWEREYGLPDPCLGFNPTLAQRRAAVASRLAGAGGQSKQYYLDIASSLGIEAEIDELRPFEVGRSGAGEGLGGLDWKFVFLVRSRDVGVSPGSQPSIFGVGESGCGDPIGGWDFYQLWLAATQSYYFNVGASVVGDPLVRFENKLLECVINRLKPAHTFALFAYEE